MNVSQTLKKLGLNDKEIKLYLTLLKVGKTKPSVLADLIKINRTALYSLAKGLLSKGLIAEDKSGKVAQYVPLPPKNLEKILDHAKRDIKEKEEIIKKAVSQLSLITAGKTYPIPKILLIEEKNLEKFLFDNTSRWQEEIINSDGIWWGFQDKTFAEKYKKWIDFTWTTKQCKHPHYNVQFFSNATDIEKEIENKYSKTQKREMKYLEQTDFTANTWICGDCVVMIVTCEHPYYLLEIHDKMIAHNTKEIFRKLWSSVE